IKTFMALKFAIFYIKKNQIYEAKAIMHSCKYWLYIYIYIYIYIFLTRLVIYQQFNQGTKSITSQY
ncbi:MAG: hypothetical protein N7Q72_04220, partial [Spiroplasma sp. Tabriz.8]|nr:hypothetical protein [Spiroplasma sp. Tabriz.8]